MQMEEVAHLCAAYGFLTAAIIYQAGSEYKQEEKNRDIFS
jgi:hypothetical protein